MVAQGLPDLRGMREELGLSQTELADLLGVSARTIQSCEQGWRKLSPALERMALLLLVASRRGRDLDTQVCWKVVKCAPEVRDNCWPYRSGQGHLCWLLTGNMCRGRHVRSWAEKKQLCVECPFWQQLLSGHATGADQTLN